MTLGRGGYYGGGQLVHQARGRVGRGFASTLCSVLRELPRQGTKQSQVLRAMQHLARPVTTLQLAGFLGWSYREVSGQVWHLKARGLVEVAGKIQVRGAGRKHELLVPSGLPHGEPQR